MINIELDEGQIKEKIEKIHFILFYLSRLLTSPMTNIVFTDHDHCFLDKSFLLVS